jgi:hypothetical protein
VVDWWQQHFEVSSVPGGAQESPNLVALQTLFVREHNIKWIGYRGSTRTGRLISSANRQKRFSHYDFAGAA